MLFRSPVSKPISSREYTSDSVAGYDVPGLSFFSFSVYLYVPTHNTKNIPLTMERLALLCQYQKMLIFIFQSIMYKLFIQVRKKMLMLYYDKYCHKH